MKVFITGATGFVGEHVLKEISKQNYDILALSRYNKRIQGDLINLKWLYGDLSDFKELQSAVLAFNPDVVIHLAWQDIPDYSNIISTINLKNSIQLFDFIINKTDCKKIIISGSCYEYGKEIGECFEDENVKIKSFFSWAKISLYQYLILKTKNSAINFIWFRIFYVYGPGQRDDSLIPSVIKSYKSFKTPQIKTPSNKNDFIHIEDVAIAFANAVRMEAETGIYNLGYGVANSVFDICRLIEKNILNSSSITDKIKSYKKKPTLNFWANVEKTKITFKWKPEITLQQGIEKYLVSKGYFC